MPTQLQSLYTGRSGHLAVMAQFLHRGYNAAIPEVDRGDDIFVVRDEDGEMTRIQVKAANGRGVQRWYATYKIPLRQLQTIHTPELYYVFAIHHDGGWNDFVILSRMDLEDMGTRQRIGRVHGEYLYIRLSFSATDVRCGGQNLQPYRNNWSAWPVIRH